MSEDIGTSPADSVSYTRGLKAADEPAKARSSEDGISTSPASAVRFRSSYEGGSGAQAATPESIAQDKGKSFSVKPDLSTRR